MAKYSTENTQAFHAVMQIAGWIAVMDIFGGIVQWEHKRTGRQVSNVDALNYYEATQQAPVPF